MDELERKKQLNQYAEELARDAGILVRRGLVREYQQQMEEMSNPRGRIDINESLRQQSFYRKKMMCTYDAFSDNSRVNQVIKTVAASLVANPLVDNEQKTILKRSMLHFTEVKSLDITGIRWSEVHYPKNNEVYVRAMEICRKYINYYLEREV